MASPGALLKDYASLHNIDWKYATNPDWLDGESYDIVMVSGGGNDILGDGLEKIVFHKNNQSNEYGQNLINFNEYHKVLDNIKKSIVDIRNTVDDHLGAHVFLVMHGYDYAYPSGKAYEIFGGIIRLGPWLQSSLCNLNITERDEQVEIINGLIDHFNSSLQSYEYAIPKFKHLDLRNVLDKDDWDDELHPNSYGRYKLAKLVRKMLIEINNSVVIL